MCDLATLPERDGDRILRKAVDEVGGAVERINDPDVFGVTLRRFRDTGLFSNEAMIWVGLLLHLNDGLLGRLIDFADEIVRPLARDTYLIEIE